jgi:two-component system chemotaxis response regulator CheB
MASHDELPSPVGLSQPPRRVLVVADAEFIGARLRQTIAEDPVLQLAGEVADGVSAVSFLRRNPVDGVVLDIGHSEAQVKVALTCMFRVDPDLKVVMVGSLSFANVKTSMMGLMEGSAEFVPTPSRHTGTTEAQFTARIRGVLAAFGPSTRQPGAPQPAIKGEVDAKPVPRMLPAKTPAVALRPASKLVPEIVAIGSSTGGPQALFTVLAMLAAGLRAPVVITQHMPTKFTAILAQHIDRHSGPRCTEGQHGEMLEPGRAYVAPGDHHMTVVAAPGGPEVRLDQEPPRNYCRPSVDPMLESLAKVYGAGLLAVILTGMGKDGLEGGRAVVAAGGTFIAPDVETSVVWGMPGAVATAGLCSSVLPLDEIAPYVAARLRTDW